LLIIQEDISLKDYNFIVEKENKIWATEDFLFPSTRN
jgi:hypothetical protein